ncbi:MAG: hypothetical protein EZS28_032087, partial [Streblomastix strix]
YQPISKELRIEYHSSQTLLKNPLVYDRRPNKFGVTGAIECLGYKESNKEKKEIYQRTARYVTPHGEEIRVQPFTGQPPEMINTTTISSTTQSGSVRTQPFLGSRSMTIPPRRKRVNRLEELALAGTEYRLSDIPFLTRKRTRPWVSDDAKPAVEWNGTWPYNRVEILQADRDPMKATMNMAVPNPKEQPTPHRVGLIERERRFLEEKRRIAAMPEEIKLSEEERKKKEKNVEEIEIEKEKKQIREEMQKTHGPKRVKEERRHPGAYSFIQVENKKAWSCCMAYEENSPGCLVIRHNLDKWSLGGLL